MLVIFKKLFHSYGTSLKQKYPIWVYMCCHTPQYSMIIHGLGVTVIELAWPSLDFLGQWSPNLPSLQNFWNLWIPRPQHRATASAPPGVHLTYTSFFNLLMNSTHTHGFGNHSSPLVPSLTRKNISNQYNWLNLENLCMGRIVPFSRCALGVYGAQGVMMCPGNL